MLSLLFGFRGRIGRLTYFLGGLGMAAVLILPLIVLGAMVFGAIMSGQRSGAAALLGLGLLALVPIPFILWSGLALTAKRLRDIGLEPIFAMPAYMVFNLLDTGAANAMPAAAAFHGAHQTLLGVLVSLAWGLGLLFWPGQSGQSGAGAPPAPPFRDAEPDMPFPASPAPQPAMASTWNAAPARTGFGRRGL